MAAPVQVPLYFTYPQPTAYFAWHLVTRHPEHFPGVSFRWTPVRYRRMMDLQGAGGTGSPALKLKYDYADAERWAKAHGIPFAAPHRKAPVDQTQHHVHLLAQDAGADWEARWMEAMHVAIRGQGMDPTDALAVEQYARKLGVPGIQHLREPHVAASLDARLEANTQQALGDEACDVPFVRYKGESFRGVDGLEWLSARLRGLSSAPRL